jgi:glucose/arabinose dehydrogenase
MRQRKQIFAVAEHARGGFSGATVTSRSSQRRRVGCLVVNPTATSSRLIRLMRPRPTPPIRPAAAALRMLAVAMIAGLFTGCIGGPSFVTPDKRVAIDRSVIERPTGLELATYISNLTTPTAIAFETQDGPYKGAVIVAEGGIDGREPMIFGFKPDGTRFNIYPKNTNFLIRITESDLPLYGPIGGIALHDGEIFVTCRDCEGRGMIVAYTYANQRRTVVADLPAQGDFGMTDIAFHPTDGRLYFGLGAATNSGVVGIDNWDEGWVRQHSNVSDVPAVDLRLRESRFDTPNPTGGLLGGDDIAVTAPFQPFGTSKRLRINKSPTDKPTAALYSISPGGGDLRVEAHGLRNPRGLAFTEFGNLLITNNGMEMRGTRPVKDDPDTVLRVPPGGGTWFGWPDFSADLVPITDPRFQPPAEMIVRTGYPEVSFLVDHQGSGLIPPDRPTLVRGVFPSLSGASKMTFVAEQAGFDSARGNLLVALSGDRWPFATDGQRIKSPIGYKVVQLDPDSKQASDFVYNASRKPGSGSDPRALERPTDVKFGPDGALYIVDLGRIEYRRGKPWVKPGTGKVLRLAPGASPTTGL